MIKSKYEPINKNSIKKENAKLRKQKYIANLSPMKKKVSDIRIKCIEEKREN